MREARLQNERTSLWAVASLLCSLAVCPPFSLIGPLLGVWALIDFRGKPHLTGRRYAQAGIVIGLFFTLLWSVTGVWWHLNGYRPMVEGPTAALEEGFAGNIAEFQSHFTGRGAYTDARNAAMFIATLRDRYGEFESSRQDRRDEAAPADVDRARPRIPYVLEFRGGEAPAEAVFVIRDGGRWGLVLKWESIVVKDPERGDLVYPPEP